MNLKFFLILYFVYANKRWHLERSLSEEDWTLRKPATLKFSYTDYEAILTKSLK